MCHSFSKTEPALATGRGEKIQSLDPFPALRGKAFLLIHPGFGISTPWAYQNLARFPDALNGRPGRAQKLIAALQTVDLAAASAEFYNSLEAPALEKYPVLALFQEFLRANGALAALMSGSGSTTFAIVDNVKARRIARGEIQNEVWLELLDSGCASVMVGPRCCAALEDRQVVPNLFF